MNRLRFAILRAKSAAKWVTADERAATAIEYGLILALMAIAALGAFNYFGSHLSLMWNFVANVVVSH